VNPLGIDAKSVEMISRSPLVVERVRDLRSVGRFRDRIILLGVDRVDYVKGLEPKFLAMERLLENRPELVEKLVLVQVGVEPGARGLRSPAERKFAARMDQLVGRINGRFATASSPGPIYYLVKERGSLKLSEACALYTIADCMVLTPMRDGMSLILYDYVVCRHAKGRLASIVLSEFADSATSLSGALHVNPWDIDGASRGDLFLSAKESFSLFADSSSFLDVASFLLLARRMSLNSKTRVWTQETGVVIGSGTAESCTTE
jgi:trehalose-6-phosphate synthase